MFAHLARLPLASSVCPGGSRASCAPLCPFPDCAKGSGVPRFPSWIAGPGILRKDLLQCGLSSQRHERRELPKFRSANTAFEVRRHTPMSISAATTCICPAGAVRDLCPYPAKWGAATAGIGGDRHEGTHADLDAGRRKTQAGYEAKPAVDQGSHTAQAQVHHSNLTRWGLHQFAFVFDTAAFELILGDDLPYAVQGPWRSGGGNCHRTSMGPSWRCAERGAAQPPEARAAHAGPHISAVRWSDGSCVSRSGAWQEPSSPLLSGWPARGHRRPAVQHRRRLAGIQRSPLRTRS